eukprot:2943934-Pyramimonas_sp.AAC.1
MADHRTQKYQSPLDPSDDNRCCVCDDVSAPDVLMRCVTCLLYWHCNCAERILHGSTKLPFECPGCRRLD